MKCSNCGEIVAESMRECSVCGEDNGFPNVRRACSLIEVEALRKRYEDALKSTLLRGVASEATNFEAAASASRVVISRSLADVQHLTKGDHFSYASFGKQVRAGLRNPDNGYFDNIRLQFENALFPNYSEQVIFGSLTICNRGLRGYGDYDLILKDQMIAKRTSVFEENPYNFAQRHRLQMTDEFPPGYRADWNSRGRLAVAKLHGELKAGMVEGDFPTLLQKDGGDTGNSDFIEAHIYGTLNLKTVAKIVAPKPRNSEDRLLWRIVSRDVVRAGVETETK